MAEPQDPYDFDDEVGWRSYRVLRPGRGMYHDVKRRLPYYWSDITDALTYRTFASTVRIFFVNLLPALAFILDMNRQTGGFYGVNEALLSSALACIVFSTIGAQPITIVGITGLISLFNYTIYDIMKLHDVGLYPQMMVWVSIWTAIFHWLFAVCNTCDYMRYVTDFSSQSFGAYVGIIYLIKGVEELAAEFSDYGSVDGFMAVMIALLFFGTVYALEAIGNGIWFRPWVRGVLADYAYPIATIFWTGFSHIPGTLKRADIRTLPHTRAFYPTVPRPWVVDFWNLPVKWVFVAMPIGFLVMLLFYFDHNISSITAQAKQFPLKKPGGFHWDFFLLGCTSFVAGILDIPMPNGLVPQAPVHTDSLTKYESKLKITKTADDSEIREQHMIATEVVEQRLSHFMMGLVIIGTMTGPLLIVLHTIPRSLFAGVFLVVGWGSLESNGIMKKIVYLVSEPRYIQRNEPLLQVSHKKILAYISFQLFGVLSCVAISQTLAAIGFPVIMIALIPLRWKILPKLFNAKEFRILDAPTADNDVVLASLGGKPELPEDRKDRENEKSPGSSQEDKWSAAEHGISREAVPQRGGQYKEE